MRILIIKVRLFGHFADDMQSQNGNAMKMEMHALCGRESMSADSWKNTKGGVPNHENFLLGDRLASTESSC